MLSVRCKECNTELTSSNKTQVCGCPNMMTITDDAVSATDLKRVVITRLDKKETEGLSSNDLQWQEKRRKRKVRKLDFEIR
tara:strand:- start:2028 stop:2270 length:243 start_codon:yes stop_codon:yes gene_type:complete